MDKNIEHEPDRRKNATTEARSVIRIGYTRHARHDLQNLHSALLKLSKDALKNIVLSTLNPKPLHFPLNFSAPDTTVQKRRHLREW